MLLLLRVICIRIPEDLQTLVMENKIMHRQTNRTLRKVTSPIPHRYNLRPRRIHPTSESTSKFQITSAKKSTTGVKKSRSTEENPQAGVAVGPSQSTVTTANGNALGSCTREASPLHKQGTLVGNNTAKGSSENRIAVFQKAVKTALGKQSVTATSGGPKIPKYCYKGPNKVYASASQVLRSKKETVVKEEGAVTHRKPEPALPRTWQSNDAVSNLQRSPDENLQSLPARRQDLIAVSLTPPSFTRKDKPLKRLNGPTQNSATVQLSSSPPVSSRSPQSQSNAHQDNPSYQNTLALVPFRPAPAIWQPPQRPEPLNISRYRRGLVLAVPQGPIRVVSGVPVLQGEWRVSDTAEIEPGEDTVVMRVRVEGELKFLHVYKHRPSSVECELSLEVTEEVAGRYPQALYGLPLVISGVTYCLVKFQECNYLEIVEAGVFFEEFPELEIDRFAPNNTDMSPIGGRASDSATGSNILAKHSSAAAVRKSIYCSIL